MKNAAYELPEWQRQIILQKTVYHTLNKFTHDLSGNFHIAECWVPEDQINVVTEALQRGCVSLINRCKTMTLIYEFNIKLICEIYDATNI